MAPPAIQKTKLPRVSGIVMLMALILSLQACSGSDSDTPQVDDPVTINSTTGGETNAVCQPSDNAGAVQAPIWVRNIPGKTGWFASPLVADLDNDDTREIIAANEGIFVYDAAGNLLDSVPGNGSRIYAPHSVIDLEGDGVMEIVCGQYQQLQVYEWRSGRLEVKNGWPADTTIADLSPEIRGLAVDDLDGIDGLEIVATTTQTKSAKDGGAQVFVFSADGQSFQPAGTPFQAWPRYNNRTGPGGDADRNGAGQDGYGCYGLNVGIGNIDDDPQKEIIVTYDNHTVQAFNHDGQAIDASSYFSNPASQFEGMPLTWGQFIRWADPDVEKNHYHLHTVDWPHPREQEWLQWTASPPSVADLDGDGHNEVVGVPNIEMEDASSNYITQTYGVMVLEGAYGDGQRSAMRLPGWEFLPRGGRPMDVGGWYPPMGVPAPAVINIQGDDLPEIVVSLNDGCLYAFEADGAELWHFNYTHGKPIMFASEAAVADLNQDGSPEIIFATYGDPDQHDSGHLIILAADGALLHDLSLPDPGHNGNGNGAPAAPTIADLEGDGQLEILVQTFDHGMDIFTVPGSSDTCLLWTTARGGPLRTGRPSGN
jgi:hypothetical protein